MAAGHEGHYRCPQCLQTAESAMTTPVRVLTIHCAQPPWLDLEARLREDPRVDHVGCVSRPVELLLAVRAMRADAVVFFADTDQRGILSHLFTEFPDLIVLILHSSGEAVIEERCPRRRGLADTSAEGVLQELHAARAYPCDDAEPGAAAGAGRVRRRLDA
jgi:hypothetical protein